MGKLSCCCCQKKLEVTLLKDVVGKISAIIRHKSFITSQIVKPGLETCLFVIFKTNRILFQPLDWYRRNYNKCTHRNIV